MRARRATICSAACLCVGALAVAAGPACAAEESRVALRQEKDRGRMRILVEGREAVVYQYGPEVDVVHYYPVRSPSGKSMTVQKTEPYPHHRSFWLGDKVRLEGESRDASFYAPLYSAEDRKDPKPPFRDRVRHVEFTEANSSADRAEIGMKLVWEMDFDKPVLDELRTMRVVSLGEGQYLLDVTYKVTAAHGDVTFTSDWVHYAWPYVRMNKHFSVEGGGTIVNSAGGRNQKETNGKEADWVDYFNTVDGATEGLALLSHPDNPRPHKWLTRDYGTFGPRRIDARSGTRFTLERGRSLTRRVGVYVHRGDTQAAKVAEVFARYGKGEW